jgi:hypothetical protein
MAYYRRHYFMRARYGWRRMSTGQKAAVVGIAAVVLTGAGHAGAVVHAKHGKHAVDPAAVAIAPGGSAYTPASWASAFLGMLGEPQTPCNLGAVTAWENAEGGAWVDGATANPLNTTQPEPGSYGINSDNVMAYPSWQEGFEANATAITNGFYGGILSALRAGDNAQAVADAVASSPWGTEQFEASC